MLGSLIWTDDDDIETSIHVKFSTNVPTEQEVAENAFSETPLVELESTVADNDGVHDDGTWDGRNIACALKTSQGIINCARCIAAAMSGFTADLSLLDAELAQSILESVMTSGSVGIMKSALPVRLVSLIIYPYRTDKGSIAN